GFQPWRPGHAGRLHRVLPPAIWGSRLLVGARPRPRARRDIWDCHRAAFSALALSARSPLRFAAYIRPCSDHRGHVSKFLRLVRIALLRAFRADRRTRPRLHVPTELPRLGGAVLAGCMS